jgi:hypothetical protein
MIDKCIRRGIPSLSAQVKDIETADLGREKYNTAVARFALMHTKELEGILNHVTMSLKDKWTLRVVTNIVHGTLTVLKHL